MPVSIEERMTDQDLFVDYPFEEVMFRRVAKSGNIYRKFYSEDEYPEPIPSDNKLYNDAILYGDRIDEKAYFAGK